MNRSEMFQQNERFLDLIRDNQLRIQKLCHQDGMICLLSETHSCQFAHKLNADALPMIMLTLDKHPASVFEVVFTSFCKFLFWFAKKYELSSWLWNCGKPGGCLPGFPSPVRWGGKRLFVFHARSSGRHFHSRHVQVRRAFASPLFVHLQQHGAQ